MALRHILYDGIDAKAGCGHAHGGKERRLMLFADAFFKHAPMMLPLTMVAVLTIVPSMMILLHSDVILN